MRRSDIFDEFAKIAQDKGLISTASSEDIKKKLENNPRMDSLDISAIEALYGVKPDAPKEMQYKRNIMENAHPNAVVVSPSYDKLNGLVENNNERQDILMHIVQKTPDGHLVNRKYAQENLLLTLVRIGNDLDNKNKKELRVLADVCLEQTATTIKKAELTAIAFPWVAVGAGAVAAALAGVYIYQHIGFINEGFLRNHDKLVAEIDDLLNASVSWGVGRQYTQNFLNQMTDFRAKLFEIHDQYQRVIPIIETLEKARTGKDLLEIAKNPNTTSIIEAYKSFRSSVDNFKSYLDKVEANFKNETYKIRQIQDKGWLERAIDWTQILHGGWGLIADDFDDVVRAIQPYKKSITETLVVLSEAKTIEEKAQRELQNAMSSSTTEFGQNPYSTPTVSPQNTSSTSQPRTSADIDQEAKDLEQQLGDLRVPF